MGLSALKSYLTVISGLTNNLVVGGLEHPTGSAGATTGAPLNGNAVTAESIDQVVADLIATTPYTSGAPVQFARGGRDAGDAERPAGLAGHGLAHRAERQERAGLRPEVRLQPIVHGRHDDDRRRRPSTRPRSWPTVRKSVLDSVLTDGTNLQKKLGSADKQRVEQHLTSIRAIEQRLVTTPTDHAHSGDDVHAARRRRPTARTPTAKRLRRSTPPCPIFPCWPSPVTRRGCCRTCFRCRPRTSTTGTSRRT